MVQVTFFCDSCEATIPPDRSRLRCLTCADYDLCAECYATQSFSSPHQAHHKYEVYRNGQNVEDVKDKTIPSVSAARSTSPMPPIPKPPGARIWLPRDRRGAGGQQQAPLSRLATAIFEHLDPNETGVLDPSQFCAFVSALGFTAMEFPPLSVAPNGNSSPAQLHNCDAWLANWYRSFALEFTLSTRQFAPPPPVQPVNGRIRMRDELMHALMYPPPPIVQGGMPMLTLPGLRQYLDYQVKLDAANLCGRLTHLLGAVPDLTDPETGNPISASLISAACIPPPAPPPNPAEEQMTRWMMESREQAAINEALRVQRNHAIVNQNTMEMLQNVRGGWRVDAYSNRVYEQGLVEQSAINDALRTQRNHAIVNEAAAQARFNCTGGWTVDSYGNRVYKAGYFG